MSGKKSIDEIAVRVSKSGDVSVPDFPDFDLSVDELVFVLRDIAIDAEKIKKG